MGLHVFLFSDVTVEKLQAFIPQLLSLLYAEGLIHGNVTKQVGSLFLRVHPFTEPSVGHSHLTGRPSFVCCVLYTEPSPVNMLESIRTLACFRTGSVQPKPDTISQN